MKVLDPEYPIDWKDQLKLLLKLRDNWMKGQHEKVMFPAHDGYVYSLQFDENIVISGSRDNTIKIWDANTRARLATLEGHTGSVLCLQFDDTKIVSGSSDATIKIWDLPSGALLHTLTGHTQAVLGVRFRDNVLVSCSKDKTYAPPPPSSFPLTRSAHLFFCLFVCLLIFILFLGLPESGFGTCRRFHSYEFWTITRRR